MKGNATVRPGWPYASTNKSQISGNGGDDWAWSVKIPGVRATLSFERGNQLLTRGGRDVSWFMNNRDIPFNLGHMFGSLDGALVHQEHGEQTHSLLRASHDILNGEATRGLKFRVFDAKPRSGLEGMSFKERYNKLETLIGDHPLFELAKQWVPTPESGDGLDTRIFKRVDIFPPDGLAIVTRPHESSYSKPELHEIPRPLAGAGVLVVEYVPGAKRHRVVGGGKDRFVEKDIKLSTALETTTTEGGESSPFMLFVRQAVDGGLVADDLAAIEL